MNIVWLTMECPFPANSGGRNVMWNKIKRLSKSHNIYLFSIIDNYDESKYQSEIEKHCKEVKFYKRSKSFKTLIKSVLYPFPFVSRWVPQMKNDISQCCRSLDPDWIIVEFPQMIGNLSPDIIRDYKVCLSQHNIEYLALADIAGGVRSKIKRTVYKFVVCQMKKYEKRLYRNDNIDLYTFVSLEDKDFFEKEYKCRKTMLLPIGADIRESNIGSDKKNILFVAKMSYAPNNIAGQWVIDNIWSKVTESIPEVTLYIVGKDPTDELIKKAEKYKNIVITGIVDSVEDYYDTASVVIVPVLNGGGVKVKLMEALGHGKLVITTYKGLEGTDFISGEHVLTAANEEEFAALCIDTLNHPEKYEGIRNSAFDKIKKEYSWDSIIDLFEKALSDK